ASALTGVSRGRAGWGVTCGKGMGQAARTRAPAADEVMAELEAGPDFQRRKAERTAAHAARSREAEPDFALVRASLEAAGLASADFGRFTSGKHPNVIRPAVFDYKAAVPVLLVVL